MKIIADAGSTKIEWAVTMGDGATEERFTTRGFNAAISSPSALAELIASEAPALLDYGREAEAVYYYGAGCAGERARLMAETLTKVIGCKKSYAESDMLGAARALCFDSAGIACILGTGSNSCLYDGKKIIANIPPLGFILGDEGSGAVLGKIFLGKLFKGLLPNGCVERFKSRYPDIDSMAVIERVYRSERPNAFLASFAPFIAGSLDIPEIKRLVEDEFVRFFTTNVLPYEGSRSLPIHFVGSVAANFRPQLQTAATRCGVHLGKIIKSPLEALIDYHRRR